MKTRRTVQGLLSLLLTCSAFVMSHAQSSPTPEPTSGIEGVITISPIRGGPERVGVPNSRPLANTAFIVGNKDGKVTSFTTDSEGRFKVAVPPGKYVVVRQGVSSRSRVGRFGPFDVDVTAGKITTVQWQCDTGMR